MCTINVQRRRNTSFFRGLSLPLACKGLEQCIAFGIKSSVDDILKNSAYNNITEDSSIRSGISGGVAGACTALVLTPVYLVKVQLQVTPKHGVGSLNGPLAAIRHTFKRLGLIGLYTGSLPIFMGTSIGYASRFATFDKTTNYMKETLGFDRISSTIIGGSLAGMMTWLSHYPLDLIANRMEASIALNTPKMSMTSHIKEIYTHQGISGFFRGLGPCLLRAIPTNATIFLTYDLCKVY